MKQTVVISMMVIFVVIFVCLVWFAPAKPALAPEQLIENENSASTTPASSDLKSEDPSDSPATAIEITETEETPAAAESITVPSEALSPGQQSLLETFGIDPNNITITPEMISCATEAIGEARLVAIQAGETPGFLEGIALAGCYTSRN